MAKLFVPLLVAAVVALTTEARECGTAITNECKSSYDKRYNPEISTNLTTNSPAWNVVAGLYTGALYNYDPTDYTTVKVTSDGLHLYPTQVYLNITVSGTRVYRHLFMYRKGTAPLNVLDANFLRIGQQSFCDSIGIATWEKDGSAKNLRTLCSTDTFLGRENVDEELSKAYPINSLGVKFDEVFRPANNGNAQQVTLSTTFKCVSAECPSLAVIEEKFEGSQRVMYQIADLKRTDPGNFTAGVNFAPEEFTLAETDSVWLPMTASCLNVDRCYTEREICATGDPSEFCREKHRPVFVERYQEEEGEIKTGVIVAFTLASLVFVIGVLFIVYLILRNKQKHRYHYFFAIRMLDIMDTDKHLDELTADDLNYLFQYLENMLRGEINQETLYEFLSTGELGYMDWGDFAALWEKFDKDKSGRAGFLEFTSFLGHSWAELEAVKADRSGFVDDIPADD